MTGVAIPEREVERQADAASRPRTTPRSCSTSADAAFAVVTTGFTMQQYRTPALEVYGTTARSRCSATTGTRTATSSGRTPPAPGRCSRRRTPTGRGRTGCGTSSSASASGDRPLVTPEHACHVLEIMLKAQQSAREGARHPIESRFDPAGVPLAGGAGGGAPRPRPDPGAARDAKPPAAAWLLWSLVALLAWGLWAILPKLHRTVGVRRTVQALSTLGVHPGDARPGPLPEASCAGKREEGSAPGPGGRRARLAWGTSRTMTPWAAGETRRRSSRSRPSIRS